MDVINGCIKEFMVIKNIAAICLFIHANLLLRMSNSSSLTRVYCPVSKSLPMHEQSNGGIRDGVLDTHSTNRTVLGNSVIIIRANRPLQHATPKRHFIGCCITSHLQ